MYICTSTDMAADLVVDAVVDPGRVVVDQADHLPGELGRQVRHKDGALALQVVRCTG